MIAIAIDGPAGAGKSTIARRVAKKIGFIYVDTGALYRAIGFFVIKHGVDTKNSQSVIQQLKKIEVSLQFVNNEQAVILCGEDVTQKIRMPEISMAASDVSAIPQVREFLLQLQKNIAHNNNVIMDGRDIGTVVLPNAKIKIFLTASEEDRARRRYEELLEKGHQVKYEDVLADLKIRDYNDSHRAVAPLVPAKDAIVVDTTGNSLEESVLQLTTLINDRL